MDYPSITHGLSMGYPWIIQGLSMDYPGMSMDNPWTSLDFHGLPRAGVTGQPCWGNRPEHSRGTAREKNINAYLIQEARIPSGKPGWEKSTRMFYMIQ